MGHVGNFGKILNFFVSIGIAEFHDFLSFQFILKLSYSQPFHNTLNYASNTNIEEVMKFYDLSDKKFETDFSQNGRECVIRLVSLPHSVACNRDRDRDFQMLLVMGGGGGGLGGGGDSSTAFYSVKLCVMINLNLPHNVLCFSFVVFLYSMYSLYAITRVALFDERGCHVYKQELDVKSPIKVNNFASKTGILEGRG